MKSKFGVMFTFYLRSFLLNKQLIKHKCLSIRLMCSSNNSNSVQKLNFDKNAIKKNNVKTALMCGTSDEQFCVNVCLIIPVFIYEINFYYVIIYKYRVGLSLYENTREQLL